MTTLRNLPDEWLTIAERLEKSRDDHFKWGAVNRKNGAERLAVGNYTAAAKYDHEAQVWRQAAAELERFLPKRRK
jgi:ribosomal protein L18E